MTLRAVQNPDGLWVIEKPDGRLVGTYASHSYTSEKMANAMIVVLEAPKVRAPAHPRVRVLNEVVKHADAKTRKRIHYILQYLKDRRLRKQRVLRRKEAEAIMKTHGFVRVPGTKNQWQEIVT